MTTLAISPSTDNSHETRHEISASELKSWFDEDRQVQLIDVREPHEFAGGHLTDARLIPLSQVVTRITEIDPALTTVVYCKAGARSAKAILALRNAGFAGILINLTGGIVDWSRNFLDAAILRS